jgi:hypothetical protein
MLCGLHKVMWKFEIVVYLTSSCVNWGFLARVGKFKTRVKRVF